MALPTLRRTLDGCARFHGLDPERIEALTDFQDIPAAHAPALLLFCWAADILTTHNRLAIGLYIGFDASMVASAIRTVEIERARAPDLVDQYDELLLEIHAEAEALARLHIIDAHEDDPIVIAARLNGPARAAYGVNLAELRVLARSFVGLAAELNAATARIEQLNLELARARCSQPVATAPAKAPAATQAEIAAARQAVERARYTPGERHARQRLARLTSRPFAAL